MPGYVVDFWTWQKQKTAGKAALCLKIFNCILSDLDVIYKYVARHGCLLLWFRQLSLRTGIEIIIFLVTEKGRVRLNIFPALFLFPVFNIFLCIRVRFRVPLQKIAI